MISTLRGDGAGVRTCARSCASVWQATLARYFAARAASVTYFSAPGGDAGVLACAEPEPLEGEGERKDAADPGSESSGGGQYLKGGPAIAASPSLMRISLGGR